MRMQMRKREQNYKCFSRHTCLWNMAGAVEPRLYSNRNDIGVVTECWRSLTWHKILFMYT